MTALSRRRLVTLGAAAFAAGAAPPALAAAPARAGEAVAFAAADLRADFAHMYERLRAAHIDLFAFTPRPVIDRAMAASLAELTRPMERLEAAKRLQRFLALARMGHTRTDEPYHAWAAWRQSGGAGFPLRVRPMGGRLFVTGGVGAAPGDELLAINDTPASRWLERCGAYVSAETDYMRQALLETGFPRLLWLAAGPAATYRVALRRDGRRLERRIAATTAAEAEAVAAAPPRLDLSAADRSVRMLGDGVACLRPGPFYNIEAASEADLFDARPFVAFIDKAFETILAAETRDLILDLRLNPGGDNSFSDPMIAWFADRPFRFFSRFEVRVSPEAIAANQARIDHDPLTAGEVSRLYADLYARSAPGSVAEFPLPFARPREGRRFKGRVWLLIDRHSYSNAASAAALMQDYGFATVLGEPTSDMATTYGAMETFTLPRTGLAVGFPKARIVRPSGDARIAGVTPDILLPSPLLQTPADEVLAEALQTVIRRRSTAPGG